MKEGAYDYLTKPVDPQRLRTLLSHVAERKNALRDVASLRRQLLDHGRFGEMVGNAPALRSVYRVIEQAAPTAASVLVYGESGTGKELVAKTIHHLSGRNKHPFIAINCAAIPESLLENEIFGHERGAFTGAMDRRPGCFELAHTGTLFLDEIAEVSPGIQAKLLRVLQERTIRRLGGQKEQAVDVRLIAATNVDPAKAVQQGKLREDLYYRINVIGICVPPLRERVEDIPLLVETFISEFNERNDKAVKALAPEAMRVLQRYPWPGNIRELRNVIERAVILSPGEFVEAEFLPADLSGRAAAVDPHGRPDTRHDRRRSRAPPHRADARAHARQQDTGGGNSRRHRQNAAQQAQAIPARSRKTLIHMRVSLRARQTAAVTMLIALAMTALSVQHLANLARVGLEDSRASASCSVA
jgi:DNA-binding NtrC family response regulator